MTSHNARFRHRPETCIRIRIVRAPLISFPQAQGYPTNAGNHVGDLPRISRIAREHARIRTERSERAQSRIEGAAGSRGIGVSERKALRVGADLDAGGGGGGRGGGCKIIPVPCVVRDNS